MVYPTVLELANEICDELSLPQLNSVLLNPDTDARNIRRHIDRQGRKLVKAKETGWTYLQKLHSFTTVNGQEEYNLPSDFERLIINTAWDRSQLTPMAGPISPAAWQTIKSGLLSGTAVTFYRRFRITKSATSSSRKFRVDPVPSVNGDTLVFEYISNWWTSLSDGSVFDSKINNDTDLVIHDLDLMVAGVKWRWRSSHGMDIVAALGEYNELLDEMIGQDEPAKALSIVGPTYSDESPPVLGIGNIPDSGFGP